MEEKHLIIGRQDDDAGPLTTHTYPYNTLPLLKSHLHPQFVIFNAGSKLSKLMGGKSTLNELQKVSENHPDVDLNTVIMLYDAWTRPIPEDAVETVSYIDPNVELIPVRKCKPEDEDTGSGENLEDSDFVGRDYRTSGRGDGLHFRPVTRSIGIAEQDDNNNDDDDDNKTESGRGDGLRPVTRSIRAVRRDGNGARPGRTRTQITPADRQDGDDHRGVGASTKHTGKQKALAVKKKRKVFSESSTHNQQLLSEATLFSFNQQFGVAPWTDDRIRHWSMSFPKKRKFSSRPRVYPPSSHLSLNF